MGVTRPLPHTLQKSALTLPRRAVTYLVVDVTVGKHGVEVLHALIGAPIVIILQPLLDGPHIHRILNDLVIVLEGKRVTT